MAQVDIKPDTFVLTGREYRALLAVENAARRLIKEGLRLTPDGLIVREHKDNSDAHYQLCAALDAISPLNKTPF